MAEVNDAFDGILISIITQHEGGVNDVKICKSLRYFSSCKLKALESCGFAPSSICLDKDLLRFARPLERVAHRSRRSTGITRR